MNRFLLNPIQLKVRNLRQQVRLEELTLKSEWGIWRNKEKFRQEYTQYSTYLKTGLQEKETIAKFLKETESIAQETGVSIIQLTPGNQAEVTKGYKEYKAELRAEADLEQILNFLHGIQTSHLLIKVGKFSLTPKDEQASVMKLEATLSIALLFS